MIKESVLQTAWDVLIVGTGMGGAAVGYRLARAGRTVLFIEKGGNTLASLPANSNQQPSLPTPSLAQQGRYSESMVDFSNPRRPVEFIPFIGCGVGGSSSIFGGALVRYPAENIEYQDRTEKAPPRTWPLRFADLEQYYNLVEEDFGAVLLAPKEGSAPFLLTKQLEASGLAVRGLNSSCSPSEDCLGCQGLICPRDCKRTAANVYLNPSVTEYGAHILTDCVAVQLLANTERVYGVRARHDEQEIELQAKLVILAGGAIGTSALLLRSANEHWPTGLANTSGLVGRCLMRHFLDLFVLPYGHLRPHEITQKNIFVPRVEDDTGESLGSFHSFGAFPSTEAISELDFHHKKNFSLLSVLYFIARPAVHSFIRSLKRRLVMASVGEDFPEIQNRVLFDPKTKTVGIYYRTLPHARKRLSQLRARVKRLLGRRTMLIKCSEDNTRLAHCCGTCRFGDDPRWSVLDRNNKAHDLQNLFIVDASFLPTSSDVNPALTIAANALRVADHIINTEGMFRGSTEVASFPNNNDSVQVRFPFERTGWLSGTICNDIIVTATRGRLWSVLSDFALYEQWNPFLSAMRVDERDPNVIYATIVPVGKRATRSTLRITERVEQRKLSWQGSFLSPAMLRGAQSLELVEIAPGRVLLRHTEHFHGWLLPFVWPYLAVSLREGFEVMAFAVKRRCESDPR